MSRCRWLVFAMHLRRFALLVVLAIISAASAGAFAADPPTRPFTDAARRTVTLPARIERVFAAGRPAAITLFTIAPDKLLGWPQAFRDEEKAFLPERYAELPVLGGLFGRAKTNDLEVLVAAKPDVIVDIGGVDPTHISAAERIEAQTHIPYVVLDGSFENTAELYERLGELLGEKAKAAELAGFARRTFAEMRTVGARIPTDHPIRVYYARGPNGLETALAGSLNTEMLAYVGAINVASDPNRNGLATVSREQILAWNPEVVITLNDKFYRAIWTDPVWESVAAVREKRVYLAPSLPFGWFDLPASVNRLIGEHWLAAVLHPVSGTAQTLRDTTREFYRDFYHVGLSEAQLDELLQPPR
jgi:iron complex transport system substrate-binding protein